MALAPLVPVGFYLTQWYWGKKLRHAPGVKVIILHNQSVLLVKSNHGSGDWTLPGGGIEQGETIEQTAIREIQEEIGILIEQVTVHGTFNTHGTYIRPILHVVSAIALTDAITLDPFEIKSAKWFLWEDARQQPSPILRQCLDVYQSTERVKK
ncbi:MAG: hypothetical protein RIQ54_506 [Candidatus Parcubacteria bacterium]|jgi:8-oxo-dGTP pyrophosphatase MutT (NUDIX family)